MVVRLGGGYIPSLGMGLALKLGIPKQGGGGVTPTPPAGFALRQTSDGQYVQDTSGNYEIVRAA